MHCDRYILALHHYSRCQQFSMYGYGHKQIKNIDIDFLAEHNSWAQGKHLAFQMFSFIRIYQFIEDLCASFRSLYNGEWIIYVIYRGTIVCNIRYSTLDIGCCKKCGERSITSCWVVYSSITYSCMINYHLKQNLTFSYIKPLSLSTNML